MSCSAGGAWVRLRLCRRERTESGEDDGKLPLKLTDSPSVTRSSFEGFGGSEVGSVKMSQAYSGRSIAVKTMVRAVLGESCSGAALHSKANKKWRRNKA
ncbi:hypothetical protein GQ457_13G021640 [Hibiscus cannabinus]